MLININKTVLYFIIFKFNSFYKINLNIKNDISDILNEVNDIINYLKNNYNIMDNTVINCTYELNEIINLFTTDTSEKDDSYHKNMINSIYKFYLMRSPQLQSKDYNKYYNNELLIQWIYDNMDIKSTDIILDGNMKINSYLDKIIYKNEDENSIYNKYYGFQNNPCIKKLLCHNILINKNINFYDNIIEGDILTKDITIKNKKMNFDVIFFDMISDKHNIIHANCCDRIKKYKIRGTNYESLMIQWVLSSLNKGGRSSIIIPNSFLYGESNQIIETKKYIINNMNITKIVQFDDSFYYYKGCNKNSIMFFENNLHACTTSNINFSSIKIDCNNVVEYDKNTITVDNIKNNNYSLYKEVYKNSPTSINSVETDYKLVKDIFTFTDTIDTINSTNTMVFVIPKYYKNSDSILYMKKEEIINDDNENQYIYINSDDKYNPEINYYYNYLYNILKNKINLFVKGKLNNINIEKIKNINIPIISIELQQSINSYYTEATNIYNYNIKLINTYKTMKKTIFNTFNNNNIKLEKLVNIVDYTTIKSTLPDKIIGVMKNSSQAGKITLLENKDILDKSDMSNMSNNMYYLTINKNSIYNIDFLYYYLQFNKDKIFEMANLTKKPNLSKNQLENLILSDEYTMIQEDIMVCCKDYDNSIMKLELENSNMKDKDIITILNKIYNFSILKSSKS